VLLISPMRRGSRSSSQPGQLLIARLTRRLLVQVNELNDLLFDGVQQLPAGALAAAAGLGAHPTVLVHLGMPLALVTAVPGREPPTCYRRGSERGFSHAVAAATVYE